MRTTVMGSLSIRSGRAGSLAHLSNDHANNGAVGKRIDAKGERAVAAASRAGTTSRERTRRSRFRDANGAPSQNTTEAAAI